MFDIDEFTINTMINAYDSFKGTGLYVLLFIASIIFVLFNKKIKKNVKVVLGVFSVIIFIITLNPIFTKIYVKVLGDDVYWRVYWMFPISFSIAFMLTYMVFSTNEKSRRILLIMISCLLIVVSGDWVYNSENFQKVNNYYKIEDELLDIVNYVSNDEGDYKKLVGPADFEIYTRQIDGTINLEIGRVWGEPTEGNIIYNINNINYNEIKEYSVETNTNYVVLENINIKPEDNLSNYNFKEIYKNNKYTLYKLNQL